MGTNITFDQTSNYGLPMERKKNFFKICLLGSIILNGVISTPSNRLSINKESFFLDIKDCYRESLNFTCIDNVIKINQLEKFFTNKTKKSSFLSLKNYYDDSKYENEIITQRQKEENLYINIFLYSLLGINLIRLLPQGLSFFSFLYHRRWNKIMAQKQHKEHLHQKLSLYSLLGINVRQLTPNDRNFFKFSYERTARFHDIILKIYKFLLYEISTFNIFIIFPIFFFQKDPTMAINDWFIPLLVTEIITFFVYLGVIIGKKDYKDLYSLQFAGQILGVLLVP
jgi:hypothetical protein